MHKPFASQNGDSYSAPRSTSSMLQFERRMSVCVCVCACVCAHVCVCVRVYVRVRVGVRVLDGTRALPGQLCMSSSHTAAVHAAGSHLSR